MITNGDLAQLVLLHILYSHSSLRNCLGYGKEEKKIDAEEGNTQHVVGCVRLLRGGAHTATRKRSQERCTQGINPLKAGQCTLNTAQYVEKEEGN